MYEEAGFVYVIQAENGHVKIGRTGNLFRRYEEIKRYNAVDVKMIAALYCDDAKSNEHFFHRLFDDRRVKGEWFDIDADELTSFISTFFYDELDHDDVYHDEPYQSLEAIGVSHKDFSGIVGSRGGRALNKDLEELRQSIEQNGMLSL